MKSYIKILAALCVAGLVTAARAEDKIILDGSTTVGPIAKAWAEYYMKKNPGVNITVGESGSGNGAKSIINGTCDIADMSRPMKDEEKAAAKAKGVNATEHVVAWDGLSVVVHPSNPVKNLTIEQLRKIYMGEVANWKDLGGPDAKIVVLSRDTNSGTYETWETKVMNKQKMTDKAEYAGSNGAIRQRVIDTTGAIGYVGLAFTEGVKIVTVEGIEPTPETVLNKTYPIARPLYMYTNGEPDAASHIGKFIGLFSSADGKKIIEETGFIPVK